MFQYLILAAVVMLACVALNRVSGKLGIPMLLAFILIGMFFGSDGMMGIHFDNYALAEKVCSVALVMIMFFGGFGTKWSEAKPVAAKSLVLSSAGTLATAGLVGIFCWKVLGMSLAFGLLLGSVISSTDAASVFSILRTRKLNLKDNMASVLELESGSNDPFAYMMMIIILNVMEGDVTAGRIVYLIFAQLFFGILFGVGMALIAVFVFRKFRFQTPGFDAIFIIAIALISFAGPEMIQGNGYLAAYITGIILGNAKLPGKQALVHFFDGMTSLMQILLFFLLGLLATPSALPSVALPALAVAVFLTFVARPLSVFIIMKLCGGSLRQIGLISWSGIRGAASIVFTIMAVINPAVGGDTLYHIVFCIVLFSIALQGSLMPFVAKKLDMIDDDENVLKTFTDYSDMVPVQYLRSVVPHGHPWDGRLVRDLSLPPESIIVLVIRGDEKITPGGKTVIHEGDVLVISGRLVKEEEGVSLSEEIIEADSPLAGKSLSAAKTEALVIMIIRGEEILIPKGQTVIETGDILVYNDTVDEKQI